MSSKIKETGLIGTMLRRIAVRGGRMTTDYAGFPPAKVMKPFQRRGLVELVRQGPTGTCRYSVWHLTPKGWAAIGMTPPEA